MPFFYFLYSHVPGNCIIENSIWCNQSIIFTALRADFRSLQLALAHNLLFISSLISLAFTLSSFSVRYRYGTNFRPPHRGISDTKNAEKRGSHIRRVPHFLLILRCLSIVEDNKKVPTTACTLLLLGLIFIPNRSLENIESCGHPCKRLLYNCLQNKFSNDRH